MDVFLNPTGPVSFNVMAKPVGSVCNLECAYCYYLEKQNLYKERKKHVMPDDVLEAFIQQYIQSVAAPSVQFVWHGGEPAIRGLDFYRKVVDLQQKHARGKVIENSLQTNGTLLDEEWCLFLKQQNWLVGVSIDGPEHCHDHYRVDKEGKPSFARVMKGIELMIRHGVEFNTLSVVNDYNSAYPLEVYRFLKSIGSRFMQFIPIVERVVHDDPVLGTTILMPDELPGVSVTPWSVSPMAYGQFITTIFDEWVIHDVGRYFVPTFDALLANMVGEIPGICVYAETCGHATALEFNGDLFACDHYVFEDYKLGNILEKNLLAMMYSPGQLAFGAAKKEDLPGFCRRCEYLKLCHGECPKNRFAFTPEGEPGLNYLCPGFKHIYARLLPYLKFMANELKHKRAPANVMEYARRRQEAMKPKPPVLSPATPTRAKINGTDPCPCGSGKMYKQCCRNKPRG